MEIKTLSHIDFVLNWSEVYTGSGKEYESYEKMYVNGWFEEMSIIKNDLVLKLFDEVIMNAVDNIARSAQNGKK